MGRFRNAPEHFGLIFMPEAETEVARTEQTLKKPGKSNKTISAQAEHSQKMNATNRSRKSQADNG